MLFSTTVLIKFLPPLGISTSTYLFNFINCIVFSFDVSSINVMQLLFTLSSFSLFFMISVIFIFVFIASDPPFKTTTFPVLKHSANASVVTFGRAS